MNQQAPMTQGQFQTLLNEFRKLNSRFDDFEYRIQNIETDIKTIAFVLDLGRDSNGRLIADKNSITGNRGKPQNY